MLKKLLLLLLIALVASGVYFYLAVYPEWNRQLDAGLKRNDIFVDLCKSESRDKQCLEAVNAYFEECKNESNGAQITFLNMKKEYMKFLFSTYDCIKGKSHHDLPSLGDYMMKLGREKYAHEAN